MSLEHAHPPPQRWDAEPAGGEEPDFPARFRFGVRDHLVNLGFWTLFGAVTAANLLSNDYEPAGDRRAVAETIYWLLHSYAWAAVTPLVFWLVWWFVARHAHRLLNGALLIGAGVGLTVLVDLVQGIAWEHLMGVPPFGGATHGGLPGRWLRLDDEAITLAAIFAAGFLREDRLRRRAQEERTARLAERAARLQAQLARARLAVLRSQLNPHFLFNSLNALSALLEIDPPGAQRMIARLSELLRHALEAREEEEIPLHEELALTRRYLEILEIRFQGRLNTRVTVEPEVHEARVPNLVLQPLLENAMKHGVGRAGGRGWIEVEARRAGDSLVLRVSDTGGGRDAQGPVTPGMEGSGTGLGLRNTRARLQELYGTEQHLKLIPRPEGGTTVEIVLPLRTRGDGGAPRSTPTEEGAHA